MTSIEKEPIYDVYCIRRRQYHPFLGMYVLGGVVMVVGSSLARGKIF